MKILHIKLLAPSSDFVLMESLIIITSSAGSYETFLSDQLLSIPFTTANPLKRRNIGFSIGKHHS